ncbi:hypothetical protein ACM66B_002067 [Microbotryomycetes sp. NB124-2]
MHDVHAPLTRLLRRTTNILDATPPPRHAASLIEYAVRFMSSMDSPLTITARDVPDEAKQHAIEVIQSCLDASQRDKSFKRDAPQLLDSLRHQLETCLAKLTATRAPAAPIQNGPTANLDDEDVLEADVDIAFVVADLVYHAFSPLGSSSTEAASTRLFALLQQRQRESKARGSNEQQATCNALLETLLAATAGLRASSQSTTTTSPSSFFNQASAFSRLPELLAMCVNQQPSERQKMLDALQRAVEAFAAVVKHDRMDVDETSAAPDILRHTVTALYRQHLLGDAFATNVLELRDASTLASPAPVEFSGLLQTGEIDGAREAFGFARGEVAHLRPLATALEQSIISSAQSLDLRRLAHVTEVLASEPVVVSCLFLHVAPCKLLGPIRESLDAMDKTFDSFGDGPPMEAFGKTVLSLQIILRRHQLMDDVALHLGSVSSFFSQWIPSVSAVYALEGLSATSRAAVDDWIEGLFGEGISDELMSTTNPQTLLYVAPTICKQALAACNVGVIDEDTLWNSLSFFLQDLLSFTLPGVLLWLVDEILRTPLGTARTRMLTTLNKFIFPESQALPALVLEIVAPRLSHLAAQLEHGGGNGPASTSTDLGIDVAALKRVIKPFWTGEAHKTPSSSSSSASATRYSLQTYVSAGEPIDIALTNDMQISLRDLVSLDTEKTTMDESNRRRSRLRRLAIVSLSQPNLAVPSSRINRVTFTRVQQMFKSRDLERLLLNLVIHNPPTAATRQLATLVELVCTILSHAVSFMQTLKVTASSSSSSTSLNTIDSPIELVKSLHDTIDQVRLMLEHGLKKDEVMLKEALDRLNGFQEVVKKDEMLSKLWSKT